MAYRHRFCREGGHQRRDGWDDLQQGMRRGPRKTFGHNVVEQRTEWPPIIVGIDKEDRLVVKTELLRDPTIRPLLVLISDGRGNISMFKEEPLVEAQKVAQLILSEKIDALVIDSARDFSHLPSVQHLARVAPMYQTYAINACADLAERMGARYYGLYDLSRDEIASAVERELRR